MSGQQTQLLLWVGAGIAITLGAVGWILNIHSQFPHKGAVREEAFQQLLVNQGEWRDELRGNIAEIKKVLWEVRRSTPLP